MAADASHRCAATLALLVGLLGTSCKDPASVLTIQVCGALEVPEEIDAIRVVVRDEDRSEVSAGVSELAGERAPDGSTLGSVFDLGIPDARISGPDGDAGPACEPATRPVNVELELTPGEGRGWVEVVGLHDGVEVVRAEVRHAAANDPRVVLALERVCLGATCPLGQTCIGGVCERVPEDGDAERCGECP